ncbi:sortase B [Evansella caseinilytica]|uniref:Sortase B n=1 Tax=Evansella caseinilytica TaxID=1503961 RepID=A0A1H3RDN1_9BACI|nr:class B sortase [Evansella caseinilytica]SDZ23730.1 sortase B [Evansella caseinilytica]
MEAVSRKQKKKRSVWQRMVTLVLLGIILYSAYKLGVIAYEYYENRQVLADAQKLYHRDSPEAPETAGEEARSSFDELLQINEDIVGWLTIEQTLIDYPVLQAQNNDYYLDRNYKREQTRAGSIFMDYRNDIRKLPQNTILYGHNMKDGSMFGQLKKFLDEDFFSENRTFYYDTLYDGYEAEVISVYLSTTDFYYIQTDFSSDEEYMEFLESIQARSLYDAGVELMADDAIITLSTCDYTLDKVAGRLVVHAKLVERGSS